MHLKMVFIYYWIYIDPPYKVNGNDLEMKLKDFLSIFILEAQVEINAAVSMFLRELKQKRLYAKEICNLMKTVIGKKRFMKAFISLCWNR